MYFSIMDPHEYDFDTLMERLLNNPPAPPKTFSIDLNTGSIYETFKVLSYIFTELVKLYIRTHTTASSDSICLDILPENFIDFINDYMRSFGVEAHYIRYTADDLIPPRRLLPHRQCTSPNLEDYNLIISTKYSHSICFYVF